ncbi:MAG: hypothetical protein ACRYG2_14930, partial [Janthinobacterium lividum]
MSSPQPRQRHGQRVTPATPRRKTLAYATAVAAAGVLVAGLSVGPHQNRWAQPGPILANPAARPHPAATELVATDLGPLTPPETSSVVSACSNGDDPATFDHVHYARKVSDGSSATPQQATIVSNDQGEYRTCVFPPPAHTRSTTVTSYGAHLLGP